MMMIGSNLRKPSIVAVAVLAVLAALWAGFRPRERSTHPKSGPVIESVYGVGTVTSRNVYQLKPGITTQVKYVEVEEGQRVRKGQVLVTFDEGSSFRAPFDGMVTALPFHSGETVFPPMPVLTITDMDHRYVLVSLEQSGAILVKAGQRAFLTFDNLRDNRLEAKVVSVYPGEGVFLVRLDVGRFPPEVLVGMTGDAAIQVSRRENVLQIPMKALKNGQVRLRRQGKVIMARPSLGMSNGDDIEVTDGSVLPSDEILY
jgi:multidrug efflux pump subunit AcrA (membrane-fusion protein)